MECKIKGLTTKAVNAVKKCFLTFQVVQFLASGLATQSRQYLQAFKVLSKLWF